MRIFGYLGYLDYLPTLQLNFWTPAWDDFDRVFGQFPGICHAVSCPMYPGAGVPVRYQILVGLLPKLSGP